MMRMYEPRQQRSPLTLAVAGLTCAAIMVGCGTQRTVTVRTDPMGADVWVNGARKGQSPWTG
ncbi:MAG: hypothetical protein QGG74_00835, partial [Phycisphaerales bacterium]|nr:hypothetical protein [Phycisphaerales bacterium]